MSSDTPDSGDTPTPDSTTPNRDARGKRRSRGNLPAGFGKGAYVDRSAIKHQGRVLAMQSLYEMDSVQRPLEDIIERIRYDDAELPASVAESMDEDETGIDDVPRPVADHAIRLVEGVVTHLDEIDPVILAAAPQFPVAQLAAVDRSVLRLAIYELHHLPDVPYRVVINEAVEIAKRFGGPNSGKFVNGVLGTISRQLPPERTADDPGQSRGRKRKS
jgi:transcription antitermination protein NusB